MMGLIWFVQLVHYPLFAQVGEHTHILYHRIHIQWTTWAVGPAMLIELATDLFLCWAVQFEYGMVTFGFIMLMTVWLSTVLLQIPCHNRLALGFEVSVHRRLVLSNWIRTIAWSLRDIIALWVLR